MYCTVDEARKGLASKSGLILQLFTGEEPLGYWKFRPSLRSSCAFELKYINTSRDVTLQLSTSFVVFYISECDRIVTVMCCNCGQAWDARVEAAKILFNYFDQAKGDTSRYSRWHCRLRAELRKSNKLLCEARSPLSAVCPIATRFRLRLPHANRGFFAAFATGGDRLAGKYRRAALADAKFA